VEYFEEDTQDTEQVPPIDLRRTLVLAVSTTILGVVFVLQLIGDQVAASF
jgi:hypothetical protein